MWASWAAISLRCSSVGCAGWAHVVAWLNQRYYKFTVTGPHGILPADLGGPFDVITLIDVLEHIERVLRECNGNISKAARMLGMHRRTLQRILAKRAPR